MTVRGDHDGELPAPGTGADGAELGAAVGVAIGEGDPRALQLALMTAEHPALAATQVDLLMHHHTRIDRPPVEGAAGDVEGTGEVRQWLLGVGGGELQCRGVQSQRQVGRAVHPPALLTVGREGEGRRRSRLIDAPLPIEFPDLTEPAVTL